jgi:PAS domain S-box-containing protein
VTHFVERLLDRAPIGVLNVDVRGMILGVNRYACQVLAASEREALGVPFTRFLPPAEHARLRGLIGRCVAPVRKQTPEIFEIDAGAGRQRHVEVIASSLVDRTGQLGSTLILQDVTDRVLAEHRRQSAEAALRESERRYREVVQTMNEGLAMTDAEYRITFVNQAFSDMFGLDSEALVGRPLHELVHPDHARLLQERMAIRGMCGSSRFEAAWIAGDGQILHTLTSPRHFFDQSGDFTGCLGVFTDITESKRIERLERQRLLELAHVSRVTTIGQMSSQIAHELSQPLTAINALSSALVKLFEADAASIDETRDTLREISGQAKRARDIVIRLRDFVRKSELQFDAVDLNDTIRTVLRLANVESRHRGMTVALDLAEDLPEVTADRVLLEQVLLNLVRNAIDAMESLAPTQRRLRLSSAMLGDDAIRITVADSGPGLTEEYMPDLFQPFFTTKTDGMGMGLAITRSIIEAHGGTIDAEQNPGGGALFRFTVPTAHRAEQV